MYNALGYPIPQFAHIPLILGSDKAKLSKRHTATAVLAYRDNGYLPEALVNYLVRLGWGYGDQEIFSLQEMIEKFSLEGVGKSAGVFNTEKLLWLNQHYIKETPPERLAQLLVPYLEKKGYSVSVPAMPHPEEPTIDDWVGKVAEVVGQADAETYLVGHSIGCQTVLRYVQALEAEQKVGGVLLVAPFTRLDPAELEDPDDQRIAKPWIETPLYWDKMKEHCERFEAIFSQDDPCVPVENAQTFAQNLGAKIVLLNGLKHINGEAGVTELPEALEFFE